MLLRVSFLLLILLPFWVNEDYPGSRLFLWTFLESLVGDSVCFFFCCCTWSFCGTFFLLRKY